jgi:hypothetical protein
MGELGRRFQRHMVLRFKPHSGDDPPRRGRGAPKRLARWRLRSPAPFNIILSLAPPLSLCHTFPQQHCVVFPPRKG